MSDSEKYKFSLYNPDTMESEERDSSVSKKVVEEIEKRLKSIDGIQVTPTIIEPSDLGVRFGVIEKVDGKATLTHHIVIQPNIK